MKDKQMTTTIIVSAVVAIVASLVTALVINGAYTQFSPRLINANSCNADETCEVNSLLVNRGNIVTRTTTGSMSMNVDASLPGMQALFPASSLSTTKPGLLLSPTYHPEFRSLVTAKSGAFEVYDDIVGKGIYLDAFNSAISLRRENPNAETGPLRIVPEVAIENLRSNTGPGNAYVCVDESGRLWRSISPCI